MGRRSPPTATARNELALLAEGIFYFAAGTCLDPNLVVPLFLRHLGASALVVGLSWTLRQVAFLLPQVFLAPVYPRLTSSRAFALRAFAVGRGAVALFVLGAWLWSSPTLWIVGALVSLSLFQAMEGLSQAPWLDLFGRTVASARRGRILGWVQAGGGIGSLIASLYIQASLSGGPFPADFLRVFALGALALLVSLSGFALLMEERRAVDPDADRPGLRAFLRAIPDFMSERPAFRRLVVAQALAQCASLALPFYIVFAAAARGLALPPDRVAPLVVAQVLGGIAGGLVYGRLADRRGQLAAVQAALTTGAAAAGTALVAPLAPEGLRAWAAVLLFVLVGMAQGGWVGFMGAVVSLFEGPSRMTGVAVFNLLSSPFALLPLVSGLVVSHVGFSPLFLVALTCQGAALVYLGRGGVGGVGASAAEAGPASEQPLDG